MRDYDIKAAIDWLIDGARSAPLPQEVLVQLCDRLAACGIPLWRVAVFVNTLHPQIICRRFIWRPGAEVEISEGRFGLFDTPEFRENPVAHVYATRKAIRRRLADSNCAMDFVGRGVVAITTRGCFPSRKPNCNMSQVDGSRHEPSSSQSAPSCCGPRKRSGSSAE